MDTLACGDCYRWAAKSVIRDGGVLVHGTVVEPFSSPPHQYKHAWVERDGVVQDWQTMEARHGGKFSGIGYPVDVFNELFSPERNATYEPRAVLRKMEQENHWGPWSMRKNGTEELQDAGGIVLRYRAHPERPPTPTPRDHWLQERYGELRGEYYTWDPSLSIEEMRDRWVDYGAKVRDGLYESFELPTGEHFQAIYPVQALWKYRRDDRPVNPALVEGLKKYGWLAPILLRIGRNGCIEIGEGNHRIRAAHEAGLQHIPVRLWFVQEAPCVSDEERRARARSYGDSELERRREGVESSIGFYTKDRKLKFNKSPDTLYHGTSSRRLRRFEDEGWVANEWLYMAADPEAAKSYADRAVDDDQSETGEDYEPVVLVFDVQKLLRHGELAPDWDDMMSMFQSGEIGEHPSALTWEDSIRYGDTASYLGPLKPALHPNKVSSMKKVEAAFNEAFGKIEVETKDRKLKFNSGTAGYSFDRSCPAGPVWWIEWVVDEDVPGYEADVEWVDIERDLRGDETFDGLMREWDPPPGDDWSVSYYRTKSPTGVPLIVIQHSGIEWVWAKSSIDIDAEEEAATRSGFWYLEPNRASGMKAVEDAFDEAFDKVDKKFDDFGTVELHEDERAGADNGAGADRQFAYCMEGDPIIIAFAPKASELPPSRLKGLMRHEFGHALEYRYGVKELERRLGRRLPEKVERRADVIAESVWGQPIVYDTRNIQCVGVRGKQRRPRGLPDRKEKLRPNALNRIPCLWCGGSGFIPQTGVMCRTCGGTGKVSGSGELAFHSSSPINREGIRKHGLKPGKTASYGPPAVYLFRSDFIAENYITSEPMDVWSVDVGGIDLSPDPEDPSVAAYTTSPVGPERMRFEGTYLDGEKIDAEQVYEDWDLERNYAQAVKHR